MTDERVLYRVRKTVFEMLKDRGYQISKEDQIDQTFEQFEAEIALKPSINFLALRHVSGAGGDAENEDMKETLVEPVYVVFANKEEKLSQDQMKKIMSFMHTWTTNTTDKPAGCLDLLNCIIIAKSGATSVTKKVSEFRSRIFFVGS